MDMLNFDIVKSEKVKAIFQYNLLKTFHTLFRVTELCLVIILVSWTSSRLPFALKLSGEYFRQVISILFNPFSIFLIGNIIVLCLLFKSGHLTTHSLITISNYENNEVCQKIFIENSFLNPINGEYEMMVKEDEVEEVVFEDKETIYEETMHVKVLEHAHNEVLKIHGVEKNLLRVQSEKMERGVKISGKLRGSKTENHGEAAAVTTEEEEVVHVFDELSNAEFQSAIETFIAKQVKFHKAEKLDIVLHSQA